MFSGSGDGRAYNPGTVPLTPGTRVGAYEIVCALGIGGMGEVFRARDPRLNREVAIKVLPELFATDPDRLARFRREAQTLAALNHPGIAHIHGFEEANGVHALVMELVEGDDLSTVLARGPIPLAEALPIARQIADALEAAHEQGIVHRDLKPGNVKVRPDGTVKVLDFGLAKAMDPLGTSSQDAIRSPTLTARATQLGTIIGTAAYMAPEQARGKVVDQRADIWAFGVVLFEMLTGGRAFDGADISDVLATVLKSEPDWQALPPDTPPSIRRLLRRCLEKEPRRRLSAIGDARLELEESDGAPGAAVSVPAARRGIGMVPAAVVLAVAIVATAGLTSLLRPPTPPAVAGAATHLTISLPEGDEVIDKHLLPLDISPDGTRVAYVGLRNNVRRLFLRNLAEAAPQPVAGTEGARSPFFSPDGQWIAFFADGKLKKVAVGSGAVQVITDRVAEPRGGAWGHDGAIYYAPTNVSSLWKVPAAGGVDPIEVTRLDPVRGEISHRWPQALPDGSLLFSAWTGPGPDERAIVHFTPVTGARHLLIAVGDTPRLVADRYLAYGRLDTLLAVPWRPSQTSIDDVPPISLPEFPRLENEGAANYAVSTTGTLAFVAGGASRYAQRVVWVNRSGAVETVAVPERDYEAVSLSPDGRRTALQIREGTMGLWLFDFARQTLSPLATSGGASQAPVWTIDGERVIYRGTRQGTRNLYWRRADGSGSEERLTTKPDVVQTPSSVSPDGQLLFTEGGGSQARGSSLWMLRLEGDRTPRLFAQEAANGQVSPDGRWIAYQSTASGEAEVYASPFPGPGSRIAVSANGGADPLWSADGRELYYTMGDSMMVVTVTPGPTLTVSAPRVLSVGRYRPGSNSVTPFSVSKDGRFLRIQQAQPDRPVTRIEIVLNWFSKLRTAAAK